MSRVVIPPRRRERWLLAAAFLAFGAAVGLKAWVGDDAYITLRTVDNFVRGYGLTWNPPDRVQTFTHPLWLFLLSGLHFVTRGIPAGSVVLFHTTIAASIALSLAAAYLLARRVAPSAPAAFLSLALLVSSRAFTDYSTSGLENPLAHLMVVLFLMVLLREGRPERRVLLLSLVTSAVMLCRLDLGLLLLPALGVLAWRRRDAHGSPQRRSLISLILGLTPVLLWEAFSLFYFGFPFPNTAYAKLNTGISGGELIVQGLHYVANSLRADPITLTVVLAGASIPLVTRRRGRLRRAESVALSAGILLYLLYVIRIGGDFMSGRFFTVPFILAVGLVVNAPMAPGAAWAAGTGIALIHLALPSLSPFAACPARAVWHDAIDDHGIADERCFYRSTASLRASFRQSTWPNPGTCREAQRLRAQWAQQGVEPLTRSGLLQANWPPDSSWVAAADEVRPVVVQGIVGVLGFYLGPQVCLLDYHAIGDPLLARLPAVRPDPLLAEAIPRLAAQGWRVGHYLRAIPDGYPETLATGEDLIRDENLRGYYQRLSLVVSGGLWSRDRLVAIWELNTGACDGLLRRYMEDVTNRSPL